MDAVTENARDILVSVRPSYASKILDGQKTVELRRRFPQLGPAGAGAFIYSSSPVRAVVGYVRIRQVLRLPVSRIWTDYGVAACVSKNELYAYFVGLRYGFAILIDSVRPLKTRVTAVDLEVQFGIVPPQSYRYVNADFVALLSDERLQASHRYKRINRAGGRSARAGVAF
jgi:predicted transcriptional regulator